MTAYQCTILALGHTWLLVCILLLIGLGLRGIIKCVDSVNNGHYTGDKITRAQPDRRR